MYTRKLSPPMWTVRPASLALTERDRTKCARTKLRSERVCYNINWAYISPLINGSIIPFHTCSWSDKGFDDEARENLPSDGLPEDCWLRPFSINKEIPLAGVISPSQLKKIYISIFMLTYILGGLSSWIL